MRINRAQAALARCANSLIASVTVLAAIGNVLTQQLQPLSAGHHRKAILLDIPKMAAKRLQPALPGAGIERARTGRHGSDLTWQPVLAELRIASAGPTLNPVFQAITHHAPSLAVVPRSMHFALSKRSANPFGCGRAKAVQGSHR